MSDPLDLLLFMTYAGLCAAIFHRVGNDKHIRRWWLLKTAPVRGRVLDVYRRVDWGSMMVSAFIFFDVVLISVTVGLIWGAR